MSREAFVWFDSVRAAVQADIDAGHTNRNVLATRHGMTPKAVERAIQRGVVERPPLRKRPWKKPTFEVIELVDRTCLCCGVRFKAEGKFVRRCDRCRTKTSAAPELFAMACA